MRRIVGRFCGPFLQFYVAQRVAVVVVMVVIVTGGAKRRRGRRRMAVKMKKMKKMKKNREIRRKPVKLIVIDSLTAPFREDLEEDDRGKSEKQRNAQRVILRAQFLYRITHLLKEFAWKHDLFGRRGDQSRGGFFRRRRR